MGKKTINQKVIEVVRFFVERLREDGINVSKVVVFGSQAEGDFDKDSDIDMIVVSESFRRKNLFQTVIIGRNYPTSSKLMSIFAAIWSHKFLPGQEICRSVFWLSTPFSDGTYPTARRGASQFLC